MKPITLSPAGKQPIRIARHIELRKKNSGYAYMIHAISKYLKKNLSLQNISMFIGCVSALTAWFSSIIYDSTNSNSALIVLVVSSLVGFFSLFPFFFYFHGKLNDAKKQ